MPNTENQFTPKRFASVDIEGNGYWGEKEEIIELAIVHFENCQITRHKVWLFKPKHKISAIATKIHGIKNLDVKASPSFTDKIEEIKAWIDDIAIVAHNASTEIRLLQKNIIGWQPFSIHDTLKLSKIYFAKGRSNKLTEIIKMAQLEQSLEQAISNLSDNRGRFHTALYDAVATGLLFNHFNSSENNMKSQQTLF